MEDIAKEEEIEIRPFYMTDIMRRLSELETDVWDIKQDKVKMQNIIILLIQIVYYVVYVTKR